MNNDKVTRSNRGVREAIAVSPSFALYSRMSGLGPLPRLVEQRSGRNALDRLLAEAGIATDGTDPAALVPFATLCGLLEGAVEVTADPLLPFRLASEMRPEDYGPLVRYAAGAEDLGGALSRLGRATHLQSNAISLVLERGAEEASCVLSYRPARDVRLEHHAIHVLLPLLDFMRRFVGARARPLAIELGGGEERTTEEMAESLGFPVRRRDDVFRLVFPSHWLKTERPFRLDAAAAVTARDLLEHYCPSFPRSAAEAVAATLGTLLGDGNANLDDIARKLGCARRTLQHHLNCEGASFRDIALRVRMTRALSLLGETREEIAAIAQAVGYADQAHFTRAFKAVVGATPLEFRKATIAATGLA